MEGVSDGLKVDAFFAIFLKNMQKFLSPNVSRVFVSM